MKKFLISAAMLAAVTLPSFAAKVQQNVAAEYGRAFVEHISGATRTVRNVETANGRFYIVNYAPQGWAIIAADDCAEPVIGYSTTGSLQWHNIPENMQFILGQFGQMVDYRAQKGGLPLTQWNVEARFRQASRAAESDVVAPLIKVNWNQGSPYNKYCPGSGTTKALVGCVAVAMSQAMSVQQYPSSPKGSSVFNASGYGQLSIDFDMERAYNWKNILSGAGNYDETARLLYHAGMSVQMGYGADGSGIPSDQIYRISNAFVDNFSYPENAVKYYYRDRVGSGWERLVLNELLAGRAVVYNAIDSQQRSGHSFNVDGYDENGMYHLNWGWGGQSNGYFSLNSLRDPFMNFDSGHRIVVGIGSPDRRFYSLDLSDLSMEENMPAGSVLGLVTVNGETPGADVALDIYGVGNTSVPFELNGNRVCATRALKVADGPIELMISASDVNTGEKITQGFRITVTPYRSIAESTTVTYNRSTGILNLHTKHNVSYSLIGPDGSAIASGLLDPLPELKIDRNAFQPGRYTLRMTCNSETHELKITL